MTNVKSKILPLEQTGFTLIEILLYISCAAVMLTTVAIFLSFLLQTRVHSQVIAEVNNQGEQILTIVSQIARNATGVSAQGGGNRLNFDVPDAAKSPTVFRLQNGVLTLKEGNNLAIALTNNRVTVSAVNLRDLSRPQTPGTVRLQFTLTAVNLSGRNEFNYIRDFVGSATIR